MSDQGANRFGFDAGDPPFRRLAVVLVCGLVGVLLALAALALAPPRYRASAELALPSLAAAAAAEDAATSPLVLRQAIEALPPGSRQGDGEGLARLRAMLARALHLDDPATPDVAAFGGRVTARRSGERVVITVIDDDAQDAARLADAVAHAALARSTQVPAQAPAEQAVPEPATPEPGRSRDVRDDDARARLDQARAEAEARSTAARRADEALLVGLRTRLAAATVRIAELRVRLSQIERVARSGAYRDAVPEVAQSPEITALREQVIEVKRQERRASKVLGSRHPSLRALREERRRAERQIAAELQRLAATARQELERAEAAERALSNEIETQRTGLAAEIEALTRLRQLEQAAPAASEPVPTRAPTLAAAPVAVPAPPPAAGRLVAAAVPPARPEGLPPAALLGIGLAAGCGVGTAFAATRRNRRH